MVAKIQRTEQGLAIVLSPEMIDSLGLAEGSEVDYQVSTPRQVRYLTTAEVLRSFEETLPQFDEVYRALAK